MTSSSLQHPTPPMESITSTQTLRKPSSYNPTTNDCLSANDRFLDLIGQYRRTGEPIRTNFRNLVELKYKSERATHSIHSYPAKLLTHIPYFFLSCPSIVSAQQTIADPFCGSGTVLLEAAIRNCRLVGADANPLAIEITQAKLVLPDHDSYEDLIRKLKKIMLREFHFVNRT